MRTIYIDSEFKCHVSDDGTMRAIETGAFDDKCDAFIEGFCYDDSKGYTQIYPWKPYGELKAAQAQYDADQAELADAYMEGVNSI